MVNLEIKKEAPKVFKELEEEEPLILNNEVKEEKNDSSNKICFLMCRYTTT